MGELYFKPTDGIEELYELKTPIGKMVMPEETIKFIEWLQPLLEFHQ